MFLFLVLLKEMRMLGESKVLLNEMRILDESTVLPFSFLVLIKRMRGGVSLEAATGGVLQKRPLLKILQCLHDNTCVGVSF